MDFKNLAENKGKLISYLQDNQYCADYVHWFECEINWILQESAMNEYATYEDVYRDRISRRPYSKSTQDMKKTIIGAIKQFDLYEKYPDSRCGHSMLRVSPNRKLSSEFQKITDCYYEKAKNLESSLEQYGPKSVSQHHSFCRCNNTVRILSAKLQRNLF